MVGKIFAGSGSTLFLYVLRGDEMSQEIFSVMCEGFCQGNNTEMRGYAKRERNLD